MNWATSEKYLESVFYLAASLWICSLVQCSTVNRPQTIKLEDGWQIQSVEQVAQNGTEIIVIGGSISRSYLYFKNEMWQVLNTFPYKPVREQLIIEITDSPKITILGAGALYYDAQN